MRAAEPLAGGGSIMKFQVDPTKRAAVTSVPKKLIDVPLLDRSKVVAHRQFLLNDMMMGGMMSIRTDQATVKAGPVRFDVTNWSKGMLHEMLVVAVDSADAPLPYDYGQGKVAEEQVRVLGETPELQPNASAALDLTLAVGSYLLVCNLPGHYASGMVVPLTVMP